MTTKIFNPERVKVVGLDAHRPANHPLQNETPPYPSEGLIKHVMTYTQLSDVHLVEEGEEVLVSIGRKRVLAAREANKRLEKIDANYRLVITGRTA